MHPIEHTGILRVEGLRKVYRSGSADLVLFDNLSFQVPEGQLLAIVGQSGTGKSTLLHMLGALDTPTAGEVIFDGTPLSGLDEESAASFRNRQIGYVWQFHYLLPEFTALENVAMPLYLRGVSRRQAEQEAAKWLAEVGLADRGHHRSGELSGGEQQRISLARALVTNPRLLLADEPTGDLDTRTAEVVFELIARLHAEHRLTSIVVTHNLDFAGRCDRILELRGGELKGGELQGGELQKNQPRGGENHRTSDVTKGAGRG